jgi:hypothetical protein
VALSPNCPPFWVVLHAPIPAPRLFAQSKVKLLLEYHREHLINQFTWLIITYYVAPPGIY